MSLSRKFNRNELELEGIVLNAAVLAKRELRNDSSTFFVLLRSPYYFFDRFDACIFSALNTLTQPRRDDADYDNTLFFFDDLTSPFVHVSPSIYSYLLYFYRFQKYAATSVCRAIHFELNLDDISDIIPSNECFMNNEW